MMKNYNNNDNNSMMNNSTTMNNNNDSTDTTRNIYVDNSSSIPFAEAVLRTPAQQQRQREPSRALYKLAARNLREYHGVPSMTAHKLEKTLALLGLRPRRVVVQGLAPRELLEDGSSPLALTDESSGESQEEELREAETRALLDASGDNLIVTNGNNSSSEDEDEEVGQANELFSGDPNNTYDDSGDNIINNNFGNYRDNTKGDIMGCLEADGNGNENSDKKRPTHAALVAAGMNLRPCETRPLLRALGVSPYRLVRLGLVNREKVRTEAGRRGGGPGQCLGAGAPGKRGVGGPRVGGRRGPTHGPPHGHGPPRRAFHGAGHLAMHRGEESEEEGMAAPLRQPRDPGHRGPRHRRGRLQGPPHGPRHHSMPAVRHGRGPPGGGKHGHGHGYGQELYSGGFHSEGEREEGDRRRGGGRSLEQHGPRHHGGSTGGPRGPPHGPPHAHAGPSFGGGSSRPMLGRPRCPFHGAGHHTLHPGEESEEEGISAPLGPHEDPGHRCCPRPSGGGGMGRSMMAHGRHGSPFRGGGGLNQHCDRNEGETKFYGRETGFCGGGDGGGGDMEQWWRAHLAHFHGGRHHYQ